MSIGININAFDRTYLLYYSLHHIRNQVQYINVTYQNKDYYHIHQQNNIQILEDLKSKHLIDNYILFEANPVQTPMQAKTLEKQKRNIGLNHIKQTKCSHFIDMDVDEFYKESDIQIIKELIKDYNIDHSYFHYINYYKNSQIRETTISKAYIPFITKITPELELGQNNLPLNIDPTRGYKVNTNYMTIESQINYKEKTTQSQSNNQVYEKVDNMGKNYPPKVCKNYTHNSKEFTKFVKIVSLKVSKNYPNEVSKNYTSDILQIPIEENIYCHHMSLVGTQDELKKKFDSSSMAGMNKEVVDNYLKQINKISDSNMIIDVKGLYKNQKLGNVYLEKVDDYFKIKL